LIGYDVKESVYVVVSGDADPVEVGKPGAGLICVRISVPAVPNLDRLTACTETDTIGCARGVTCSSA